MVDGRSNAEYFLLRKAAEEYRNKGYEVILNAPLQVLPGFEADLLVRKRDEVKVIAVKSRASLAASPRLRELAQVIDSKPGWSFELILVAEPERLDAPEGSKAFERDGILGRIEQAEKLLEMRYSDAALLLAWSAWEAAARVMIVEDGVADTGITKSGYILEQATFLGIISRDEYQHLREIQRYRNAIVHGFSHDGFADGLVTSLTQTVRRMVAAN